MFSYILRTILMTYAVPGVHSKCRVITPLSSKRRALSHLYIILILYHGISIEFKVNLLNLHHINNT